MSYHAVQPFHQTLTFQGTEKRPAKKSFWLPVLGILTAGAGAFALTRDSFQFNRQEPPTPAAGKNILGDGDRQALEAILSKRTSAAERQYSAQVHRQAIQDLSLLYSSPETKVTLASFSDTHTRGSDRGFGLHEIRKLEIGDKTILANIHWPFRPNLGGFTFPDEIRIRTRIFSGERGVAGSEKQYVSARYRVAWDEFDEPTLMNEPILGEHNTPMQRRVPVSVFSCADCHHSTSPFAAKFQAPFTPINPEFIVQPHQYEKPLPQSLGYLELKTYLSENAARLGISEKQSEAILLALKEKASLDLPDLTKKLEKMAKVMEYSELGGGDTLIEKGQEDYAKQFPGVYQGKDGRFYMDSMEQILVDQGKISFSRPVWWSDKRVIPKEP